ncbi:MAG TPA: aminotransferase class V-fold PLP-dependent enzyme [Ktedonobacteraceae bacterium]|nr:aminotransferase class V-fold PLP-dependent enzyme [Ktedonobacteraceae bacterium]
MTIHRFPAADLSVAPLSASTTPRRPRPRVVGMRTQVPLFDGNRVRYVNLDSAASTPALVQVQQAVEKFLPWYASVHRGAGYKSRLSTHLYEHAREVVLTFVGASVASHEVVFVRNTTEALNVLAHRVFLEPGELILTSRLEHHSNFLPWYQRPYEVIELTPDGRIDLDDLERRLVTHAGKVRLVSVSAASNVTGVLTDVHAVARLAHAHGALIAADIAQLAPHRPVAMGTLGDPERLDIVAFSGHKLYAPYGTGVLVIPHTLFAEGAPMLVGGGSACLVTREGIVWASGSDHHEEAGSPNVIGAIALAAALEALMGYGMERVAEHERELTRYAIRHLCQIPGLISYGPSWQNFLDGKEDRLGVFAFTLPQRPYAEIAAILAHEWGIGVRSGCFCAHQYVAHLLGISDEDSQEARERLVSGLPVDLPGMVRASFGIASSRADIDRLVEGLQAIACGNVQATYITSPAGDVEPENADDAFLAHGEQFLSPARWI